MKDTGKRSFNLRGFVVLTATVSGLGLPISGLATHMHQMDSLFSASRHAWMSVHTLLGILFMVFTIWHAILNRRVLMKHLRGCAGDSRLGREAVGALVLVAVLLFLAVGHAVH
jgi:hypothetical protein